MQARKNAGLKGLGVLLIAAALTLSASAQDVVLTDGGASARIAPSADAGVYVWEVGGRDHLASQQYYLTVNETRFSLGTLPSAVSQLAPNKADLTFTDAVNGFTVDVSFELTGAGLQSLLKESVVINNVSGSDLDISLVMYSDFDLGGTASGDTASLWGMNDSTPPFDSTVGWERAVQTDGVFEHTAIFNKWPKIAELEPFANTVSKLLGGTDPLNLDASIDLPATVGATSLSEYGPDGPADLTYAVQWDFVIPDGDSNGVGVDKRLVTPEPGTIALSFLGLLVLLRARKRAR